MSNIISNTDLHKLSQFIELNMALHFPEKRWNDLERNIIRAAKEFDYSDIDAFIDYIISSPLSQVKADLLASHLTINETFFWREPKTFEALERVILPELLKRKKYSNKRIKIWSAGCSGGEEPYSIAIALRRFVPDIKNWKIKIIATDISPVMLKKAEIGIYGKWSFRGTPSWLKETYFRQVSPDKFEINPEIKKMVNFSYLNLADNKYPSLINNTNAIDIIYCRNVLMYFNQARFNKVVKSFYNSLVDGGYLIVSANELSYLSFTEFETINVPEFVLYKKNTQTKHSSYEPPKAIDYNGFTKTIKEEVLNVEEPVEFSKNVLDIIEKEKNKVKITNNDDVKSMFLSGNYHDVIKILNDKDKTSENSLLLIKSLANIGEIDSAAKVCETAISKYKLDYELHFLNASILQNQNKHNEAISSLQKAIFINPDFILAYYSLANNMIKNDNIKGAIKNYKNALSIMRKLDDDEIVEESEGLTVGRLKELINSSIQKNALK